MLGSALKRYLDSEAYMLAPVKYPLNIPGLPEDRIIRENPESKWARIVCVWNQQVKNEAGDLKIIPHPYEAVINCKNYKVYNDDQKLANKFKESDFSLKTKFIILSFITPYEYAIRTIYLAILPLSLGLKIYSIYQKAKKAKANGKEIPTDVLQVKIVKAVAKKLADVIRTPLYGVALTVVALATVILCHFKSDLLYEGRVLYGEIEKSYLWGKKVRKFLVESVTKGGAPCMQPIANLKRNERKRHYTSEDTIYEGDPGTMMHALNNMVRSQIPKE